MRGKSRMQVSGFVCMRVTVINETPELWYKHSKNQTTN